jgi:hypothetical protein
LAGKNNFGIAGFFHEECVAGALKGWDMSGGQFQGTVDGGKKLSNASKLVAFQMRDGLLWVEEDGIADAGAELEQGESNLKDVVNLAGCA